MLTEQPLTVRETLDGIEQQDLTAAYVSAIHFIKERKDILKRMKKQGCSEEEIWEKVQVYSRALIKTMYLCGIS